MRDQRGAINLMTVLVVLGIIILLWIILTRVITIK